jgi:drug/metabolite transporter (DMT)-like permease
METWKALKFMVISTLAFTFMNSVIKYLDDIHPFELVFFRSIGSVFICIAYLKLYHIPLIGNQHKLMIGRGLAGVTSMALFFASLKVMPFGTTISLRYLAPIFAAILSVFILKEKLKNIQWLFFALSFLGVILIKGVDFRISTIGLILVMGAALFSGVVYIFLRAIGPGDHPVVVVNYFMVIAVLIGGVGSVFVWSTPSVWQWPFLLSLGFFGYLGQLYMTKAFQIAEASKVAPMKYLEAVFAILVGWIWFAEGYSWLGLLGMFLVIAGMLLNLIWK